MIFQEEVKSGDKSSFVIIDTEWTGIINGEMLSLKSTILTKKLIASSKIIWDHTNGSSDLKPFEDEGAYKPLMDMIKNKLNHWYQIIIADDRKKK
jgi:hypothetical protein